MTDIDRVVLVADSLVWRPVSAWRSAALPGIVRNWLLDEGSLTARLRVLAGKRFRVQVLNQRRIRLRMAEAAVLSCRFGEYALLREVLLLAGDTPWVYACSRIPVTTLTGAQRRMAYLAERPLGAFLFADPSLQRERFELAKVPDTPIWGRRSLFRIAQKPLFVSEFFLPALLQRNQPGDGVNA